MVKISRCVMCGSKAVSEELVDLYTGAKNVVSIKVKGAKCNACGEKYYNEASMKIAEEIRMAENQTTGGAWCVSFYATRCFFVT